MFHAPKANLAQQCNLSFGTPLFRGHKIWSRKNVHIVKAENREFENRENESPRAGEARELRARKTLTPRFTDFFPDFEEKTDCFAVLIGAKLQS